MTITEFHISSYGQLSDFHVRDLGHPVVCILGANEAGKSTIFSFIESMLFGFDPPKCSRHPYTSAVTGVLKGNLSYVTHDNELATVSRAMDSQVSARVDVGQGLFHKPQEIVNETIPTLVGIDRETYREVYAVSLYDLVELEEATWTSATDGILGNLGLDHFKSPAQVVAELTSEANSLWRANRVGKPRSKQLAAKITELKKTISASEAREDSLRRIAKERGDLSSAINLLRSQIHVLGSDLNFSRKSLPVVQISRKIEQFEQVSGNVGDLDHLPAKPAAFLAESASEIASIERQLSQLRSDLGDRAESSTIETNGDALLLESQSALGEWQDRVTDAEVVSRRLQDHILALQKTEALIDEATIELGIDPSDRPNFDVETVDPERLAKLANQLDEKQLRRREIETELSAIGRRSSPSSVLLAWSVVLLLGLAIAIFAVSSDGGDWFLVAVGIVVGLLGSLGLWTAFERKKKLAKHIDSLTAEIESDNFSGVMQEFTSSCAGLSFADDDFGSFSDIVSQVTTLATLRREYDQLTHQVRDLELAVESERQAFKSFAKSYGVAVEGSASDAFRQFSTQVSQANARQQAKLRDNQERKHILQDVDRLERKKEQLNSRRSIVENELMQLGGNSIDEGLEILRTRRAARDLLSAHTTTRDNDFPDWQSVLAAAETKNGSLLDNDAQEKADAKIKELTSTVREKELRLAKLAEKSESLAAQTNTLELKSQLAAAEAEMSRLRFKRDRLMLMANLIEESDLAFRERVEPELLESAGNYVRAITKGKYSELLVDEDGMLCLRDQAGLIHPVSDPTSQGTQDQVFLSLRFAVADRLDQGLERIPLALDEVFVNWDEHRRHNGYSVLRAVSERRQVFFMTCHEWLADELRSSLGARIVSLK